MNYTFDWMKYADLARKVVAEGCVLLKNEKEALPIKKGETVSVFGRIQLDYYKSGTGSGGMVNAPYVVSIIDGLNTCNDININKELLKTYEDWVKANPFDKGAGWAKEPWSQKEMPVTKELVECAAKKSDLALIIIGRTAGEDKDNSATEGSYLLTNEEEKMMEIVCDCFQRVVVVLNVGNIIDMKWVDAYHPQAVIYAWQGGMEGGNGIADVLTGKVNPSGKLTDTIANDIDDYPSTKNFGDEQKNYYAEDIYVGYRYFETIAKEKVKYPFGYGLSYTTFEKKVISYSVEEDNIFISIQINNTGNVAGKEVVQVYYCPPQGLLGKPVRNLIRFAKTKLLYPKESEQIDFHFSKSDLASYDDGGYTGHKSCYVLEAGHYNIYVGCDVRSAEFVGNFLIEKLQVVETLSEAVAPVNAFHRLKPYETLVGTIEMTEQPVPTRNVDVEKRIAQNAPMTIDSTGDLGYRFVDVYDQKVSLDKFLMQLSDDDLIHMTRGEGMCSPKVTPGTAAAFGGVTENLKMFGIPVACCTDGPSGIRMDCGTKAFSLPNGTSLACSFNLELVEKLYEMEGLELRKNNIDILLGPGMNIHRNPLNGRNFEYFSEDPYLTGKMAVAVLKGLQKNGVTGTIKHYACNNQEYKRQDADSIVSERALREIYLKGFEIAVKEGGAYSVMSTYGPLNGIWTAGNYDLLTTILRNEWGFRGIVMTDWSAKINDEGFPGNKKNTTPMVRAQNDLYMVVSNSFGNSNDDNTKEGLITHKITREQLIRNAKNIGKVLMRLPVMERSINKNKDEWIILNEIKSKTYDLSIKDKVLVENEVILDVSDVNTDKRSSVIYDLTFSQDGKYFITFKIKSKATPLAQLSISVFMNEHFVNTITMNGTNVEWVQKEVEFEVSTKTNNYLKLFFGESGIEIGEIKILKRE